MQTLSKAFGLADTRLGAAFTSAEIARLLNNLKAPYNVMRPTIALACGALQAQNLEVMQANREKIIRQKKRILRELPRIPGYRWKTRFRLLKTESVDRPMDKAGQPCNEIALAVYKRLAVTKGVVVRFKGKELGCTERLRITVGTESEVGTLLQQLHVVLTGYLPVPKPSTPWYEGRASRRDDR